jgi:L-cysteine S-thiosulfotransferase
MPVYKTVLLVAACLLVSGVAANTNATATTANAKAIPAAITSAPPSVTPEQDRVSMIAAIRRRFPAPIEDWSLGGASFAPGVAVVPLGGANATNVNDVLAIGKKAWERKFRNGKSMAACFPNGGRLVATTYPQFDSQKQAVVTLESAINACLLLHQEPPIGFRDGLTMGAISAYLRSLSVGQKLNVRVTGPAALSEYASGRHWFTRKLGHQDLACASCHVLAAGQIHDENGRKLGIAPAVGQTLAWPRIEPGGALRSLQQQFQICMRRVGAEPFELGSLEYDRLEFFLAAASTGLPIRPAMPTQ